MDESREGTTESSNGLRSIVREAIEEYLQGEKTKAEPAYKAELVEERRRREQLESRLNELVEENRRAQQYAEELDRSSTVRNELHRLGVSKVEVAYKAVKDDIRRGADGQLLGSTESGEVPVREYLHRFVSENPEFLPARVAGGSGASSPKVGSTIGGNPVDLDRIRPGMSAEELDRVRQEVARVALQAMRGQ